MAGLSPEALVAWLNTWPPELIWLPLIVVCFGAILLMLRWFGVAGLYAYLAVAVLAANVQVIKPVQFALFPEPVALGTIVFGSTYFATDVLTEWYGRAAARRGVLIGFSALVLWTLVMLLTLGYRPMTPDEAGEGLAWALDVQGAMALLFLPAPLLLVAGMTSYLISQFSDIWIFRAVRRLTRGRHLWLRASGSTALSALLDNIVFSALAWYLLPLATGGRPVGLEALIFTYILGTYVLRLAMAVLETPFMYVARRIVPHAPRDDGAPVALDV